MKATESIPSAITVIVKTRDRVVISGRTSPKPTPEIVITTWKARR